MNPTEDQKVALKKVKKRFMIRAGTAMFLYTSWLFCTNLLTIILNTLYFQNQSLVFLVTLGSTVIILTGLRGTVEEIYNESVVDAKKIMDAK